MSAAETVSIFTTEEAEKRRLHLIAR